MQNAGSYLWFAGPRAWAQYLLYMGSELLHRINSGFCFFVFKETEIIKKEANREFMLVYCLGFDAFTAVPGFNPGQKTEIPEAVQSGRQREGIKQKFF